MNSHQEDLEEVEEVKNPDAISNPMYEGYNVPMVIISIGAEKYIGGLLDLEEGLCTIGYPLRYGEFVRPGQNGVADAYIDMLMDKVYKFVGTMREMRLSYDTIYILHPDNTDDAKLVEVYQERHESIKKHDAGQIEIKEQSRIILPGVNDVIATNNSKIK